MALSPMMKQYFLLKEQYSDTILMFRLGDFYEMFFNDAQTASKVLEIALTGRDCGLDERAPMCGVPYHAVDAYIGKLIENGYKVAICEQLSDPKASKGLVDRGIIRVITSGTVTQNELLEEKKNNYIFAAAQDGKTFGMAWADISTGEFCVNETETEDALLDCAALVKPSELLLPEKGVKTRHPICEAPISKYENRAFLYDNALNALCSHFNTAGAEAFGCGDMSAGICAAGGLLQYLSYTQKIDLMQLGRLKRYNNQNYLMLDMHTRRNLELTETMRGKGKKGTLLYCLDKTCTAMGGRMLRSFIEQPLRDATAIERRLDGVEELFAQYPIRVKMHETLDGIYDIERLATKAAYSAFNPKDCLNLAQSLRKLPALKEQLAGMKAEILVSAGESIDLLPELCEKLSQAICEDAPHLITEGGIFKKGFSEELDRLRSLSENSTAYLGKMEAAEKERTGINNLRIRYNRVFGYYIEVSNSFINQIPLDYERKQTLANCERYSTVELKKLEEEILGVSERIIKLELDMFTGLREEIKAAVPYLQTDAAAVALCDALLSFASVAAENNYVRPEINNDGHIAINDGRHPVVEQSGGEMFVPNDTLLDTDDNRIMILTGPNMAGKSTYMRQVAIITLMAHMGCFVPAKHAEISITDRIFTRVGASDDLSSGQSTFMVEMNEVAGILNNCTVDSLVILDEIGRGTSTFDGLSIAWAVTEHIADKALAGCKTLFATHYHELSELEGNLTGVKNYCIQVREHGENIIFLRKILRGSADKSFGIAVARLAGLPKDVLARAKEILKSLEKADISKNQISANILGKESGLKNVSQISMLVSPVAQEIIDRLLATDVNELTPIQAMNILCELRELAKREG